MSKKVVVYGAVGDVYQYLFVAAVPDQQTQNAIADIVASVNDCDNTEELVQQAQQLGVVLEEYDTWAEVMQQHANSVIEDLVLIHLVDSINHANIVRSLVGE